MRIYVEGVGLRAQGLAGWPSSREILSRQKPYTQDDLPPPIPTCLPPNELRRSSEVVRWALVVAEETLAGTHGQASDVATVFSSSGGETDIWHQLCDCLSTTNRSVSPTLFHHSVHNAVAAYWSIGTGSMQPSISLACYDCSFAGGLLESAVQSLVEERRVLLVTYDLPPPHPIYAARPLIGGFCVGLLLANRESSDSKSVLTLTLLHDPQGQETRMDEPRLESLRRGNPAARSLPLLASIATGLSQKVTLRYFHDQDMSIDVEPCQASPSKN